MNKQIQDIIIFEIRENRKEISKLRITTNTLKIKLGFIAVVFGFLGSIVIPLITVIIK